MSDELKPEIAWEAKDVPSAAALHGCVIVWNSMVGQRPDGMWAVSSRVLTFGTALEMEDFARTIGEALLLPRVTPPVVTTPRERANGVFTWPELSLLGERVREAIALARTQGPPDRARAEAEFRTHLETSFVRSKDAVEAKRLREH